LPAGLQYFFENLIAGKIVEDVLADKETIQKVSTEFNITE